MKQKLDAMLEGMQDDLTGFKSPVKAPKKVNSDYLAMYMMGDHHFGMLADGETKMAGDDADWDVKIATSILLDSTNRLASRVGDAEIGVLLNVGDFFHADSSANTTTKGTPVDVDTRIAKTFKLAGRLFQTLINKMLETHKEVVVINVRGNHDSDMACHLSSCIELLYEKEKRVKVLQNYSKFIHYQWHNNLFVFHHGDRMKHEQILQAVIRNLDDEWSQSKNRYCHLGHIHHHTAREVGSMHFEHWGSLTCADSWHSSQGYGAERSMTAVVYHKDTGEDSRVKIKVG
jgi:predicted phosphodiesterase